MSHTILWSSPKPHNAEGALFLRLLFVRSYHSADCPKAPSAYLHPQLYHKPIYPHCVGVKEGFSVLPWRECSARKTGCTWSSGASLELWDCLIEMELRGTQCLLETVIDEGNLPVCESYCQGLDWLEMLLRFCESNVFHLTDAPYAWTSKNQNLVNVCFFLQLQG